MGVPEAVLEKVGALPDIGSMSKDDLANLCKQLYERSCNVFGEKFDVEYQVKKRDMEIHNLEMETSESHGTFKIPKLKKVKIIIFLLFTLIGLPLRKKLSTLLAPVINSIFQKIQNLRIELRCFR